MDRKFVIYNTILTFIMGFLVHGMYGWFPSAITSIFPVNESLFEHVKLIYLSPLFSSIILYFYFKHKGYGISNLIFGLIVSTMFNIIIFYLAYLPLYRSYGAIMWMTLLIYFITIILSNYLYYLIIILPNSKRLNIISSIMIIVILGILTYFTYHPEKIEFFRDPETHTYGIKK